MRLMIKTSLTFFFIVSLMLVSMQLLRAQDSDLVGFPKENFLGSDEGRVGNQQVNDVFVLVDPNTKLVQVGDIFLIIIKVQTGAQPINGASARLEFDPAILEVQSITPLAKPPFDTNFPTTPNRVDNVNGVVIYGVGNFSDDILAGDFDLIHIYFKAIAETVSGTPTSLTLFLGPTDVTSFAEGSILTGVTNGEVIVESPTAITLTNFTAMQSSEGVTIAWETGTEIDNAGFNLYRATAEAGPYTKINDLLIPAKGDPVSGASYVYLDSSATDPNQTYYFKLEDIDTGGTSTFHGPINTASGVSGEPNGMRVYLPIVFK